MIRTQLYLPEDLYARVKAIATLQHMNISEFVRFSLRKALKADHAVAKKRPAAQKHVTSKDPFAGLIGKYNVGKGIVTTAALDHNDIYDL